MKQESWEKVKRIDSKRRKKTKERNLKKKNVERKKKNGRIVKVPVIIDRKERDEKRERERGKV